jgi:alkyl sulfatase BDS1-like metallo-beta-lactamase superfamily hydrolase
MGWYDANPSTLDQLPPEPAAKKYVEYVGGAEAVLGRAQAGFDKGEYRWGAEALNHVVFADPNHRDAKELLADAYEQMGYQAESGPWRSIYLMGTYELRHSVPDVTALNVAGPDTIRTMPSELLFDYWGVRLNGEKAAGKRLVIGIGFTDLKQQYTLLPGNGILTTSAVRVGTPDARLTLSKPTLGRIQLREATVDQAVGGGEVQIEGHLESVREFFSLLDTFPFWFNIVTP